MKEKTVKLFVGLRLDEAQRANLQALLNVLPCKDVSSAIRIAVREACERRKLLPLMKGKTTATADVLKGGSVAGVKVKDFEKSGELPPLPDSSPASPASPKKKANGRKKKAVHP